MPIILYLQSEIVPFNLNLYIMTQEELFEALADCNDLVTNLMRLRDCLQNLGAFGFLEIIDKTVGLICSLIAVLENKSNFDFSHVEE